MGRPGPELIFKGQEEVKKGLLFLVLMSLAACSTRIQTIGGRLISPEAQGDTFKGTFNATSSYASSYKLNFTTNQTDAPLVHENSGRAMGAASEIGVFKPLDVLASLGSESEVGIKWQFAGDSRQSAKGGSFSASLIGLYSSDSRSANIDEDNDDNVPENVQDVEFKKKSRSYGLMAGFRVVDPVLMYVGVFRILEDVDGKVTTGNLGLNDSTFSYSNNGELKNFGFIYYSQTNIVTKVELSNLETKWTNTEKQSENGWSMALGFAW